MIVLFVLVFGLYLHGMAFREEKKRYHFYTLGFGASDDLFCCCCRHRASFGRLLVGSMLNMKSYQK